MSRARCALLLFYGRGSLVVLFSLDIHPASIESVTGLARERQASEEKSSSRRGQTSGNTINSSSITVRTLQMIYSGEALLIKKDGTQLGTRAEPQ